MKKSKDELDDRKKKILELIINEYIVRVEPVSSNTIITRYNLDISSATVRNDMMALEKMGYLEKTHLSSGRVPSNKGYEFYINNLLDDKNLSIDEIKYINSKLKDNIFEIEELTKIATNTISEVTHYTAISIAPNMSDQIIQEIKFMLLGNRMLMAVILTEDGTVKETIIKFNDDISQEQVDTLTVFFNNKLKGRPLSLINVPLEKYIINEMNVKANVIKPIAKKLTQFINSSDELYYKGADRLLDNPEFRSNELAKKFYGILDNGETIVNLLSGNVDSSFETDDFKIYIGNSENGLKDLSIIAFKNEVNGKDMGTIGIIGPTRMNYSKVISALKYINKKLNEGEKIENIKIPLMLGNGNIRFLEEHNIIVCDSIQKAINVYRSEGKVSVIIADREHIIGIITLSDTMRNDAINMISAISSLDMTTVLLTGDSKAAATYIGKKSGVSEIHAELLPGEKVSIIESLQGKHHKVCMVGDGINDAPAMKTADVSIAMGTIGSDIAIETADIALMSDDLSKIPYIKRLSDATIKTIKFSIALSMAINCIAIILSLLEVLTPTTGALVHNVGSCLVVLIAARLYDRKFI